jgi:hypothetical protein
MCRRLGDSHLDGKPGDSDRMLHSAEHTKESECPAHRNTLGRFKISHIDQNAPRALPDTNRTCAGVPASGRSEAHRQIREYGIYTPCIPAFTDAHSC